MKGLFGWKSLAIAIVILLILVIILIVEISNRDPLYNEATEFEFELSFGCYGRNNINTFKDTITKDLVSAGSITVDYEMPERVKKEIFRMMRSMDIMSYPENLNFPIFDEHVEYLYLRVVIGEKEQIVRWTVPWGFNFWDDNGKNMSLQHYQFKILVEYISRHVYESKTWKALPKHEGGYL